MAVQRVLGVYLYAAAGEPYSAVQVFGVFNIGPCLCLGVGGFDIPAQ